MNPSPFPCSLVLAIFFCLGVSSGSGAPVDFVREVRPIFEKHCYECHGAKKQKSGFRLDVKSVAFSGGDHFAPNIIAGNAKDSPLMEFIASDDPDERMPPKGARLSAAEVATLTAWIAQGAVWPDGVDAVQLKDPRDHWSFKPLAPQEPNSSIDGYIRAALARKGLAMSPAADRRSWLRRVNFDLTGLPPTLPQLAAFLNDNRPDAWERVVDGLLQSPRYGERWGQHWLDVVRYADTHGFEVNTERPNAWPYRDYVIAALNADIPYDQFIREQICGDALGKDAATGFLVTASVLLPGQIGKDAPSMRLARQDSLDEIVNNISQTFLGLSVGCARCHDHKFDPITARDYYAMQAFVAGVHYGDRTMRTPEAEAAKKEAATLQPQIAAIDSRLARLVPLAKSGGKRPMVNARENVDRFAPVTAKRVRFTIRATNNLEPCLDEIEVFDSTGTNVALASAGARVCSSGDIVVADRHELKHIHDGEYGNSRSWMSHEKGKGWVEVEFSHTHQIERVVWGRDRLEKFKDRLPIDYAIEVMDPSNEWRTVADASDRHPYDPNAKKPAAFFTEGLDASEASAAKGLMNERRTLEARVKAAEDAQKVFAGTFRTPDDIRLLSRGDPEQAKDEVLPASISALSADRPVTLTRESPEQQRRVVLADWIASPQNPLTARVMVNRIWQGHFGAGLVSTPSDFGNSGMPPSHPELLDWLAREFIRAGWSMKHMHRLIVLSDTYRQSSATHAAGTTHDADVRLLWRFPARRIEAETIRDSMLAISGRLNLKMYGRGYDLFDKRGGLSGFDPIESFTGDGLRRMIYAHKVRRETEAVFGAFDCPDAGQSTAQRRESTTPIQALNLLNSTFTLEESAAFAARIKREAVDDLQSQIRLAYLLALSREPAEDELSDLVPIVHTHGLSALCRALYNSNEFLFIP